MLDMSHFATSRYRYVYPPTGDGIFCAGTAVDDMARISWGRAPEDPAAVRSLYLHPTVARLRRPALPRFLPELVNLESLRLPTPLVARLTPGAVGSSLRTLVISHDHTHPVPVKPLDLGRAVPGLRALMWVTSVAPPSLAQVVDPLPPLEFLHTNVSGNRAVLRQIGKLTTLRHLELSSVGNADIFDHLAAPLQTLEIAGTGRDFPIGRLAAAPTLQTVRLNGVRADVDCAVFRALPDLVEVDILHTRRSHNIEALLECPRLTTVRFLNCGNPFKRGRKALFEAAGFDHLDIDFA